MSKQYTDEFRGEAVRLVLESKVSLAQVARDLGVSGWTLRGWVKKHREKCGVSSPARRESLEEENRRLKREVAILRQERDILKKAAAYFAKEQL
jgi:transposase